MKTILFDFFNVIGAPVYEEVLKKYIPVDERGEWLKKVDALDLGDMTEEEFIKELYEYVGGENDEGIRYDIRLAYAVSLLLLKFIRTHLKGRFTIGLLTNAPRSLIETILEGQIEVFDILIISSDYHVAKPDPKIFEIAIEKSGCKPEEILFIDDKPENIEAAQKMGMHGIVYTSVKKLEEEIKQYIEIIPLNITDFVEKTREITLLPTDERFEAIRDVPKILPTKETGGKIDHYENIPFETDIAIDGRKETVHAALYRLTKEADPFDIIEAAQNAGLYKEFNFFDTCEIAAKLIEADEFQEVSQLVNIYIDQKFDGEIWHMRICRYNGMLQVHVFFGDPLTAVPLEKGEGVVFLSQREQ